MKITRQPIVLEMRGYTRGRGSNPKTGKPGTLGSRTKLKFYNKQGSILNYETLKSKYRKYFGLLLAKLYASKPTTELARKRYSKPKNSLHRSLKISLKTNSNSKLNSDLKLTLYNSSSKITELFLLAQSGNLPLEWLEIHPNLLRELQIQ